MFLDSRIGGKGRREDDEILNKGHVDWIGLSVCVREKSEAAHRPPETGRGRKPSECLMAMDPVREK